MKPTWSDPRPLFCPKCHRITEEQTSTGNGFCRPCDYIFAKDAKVLMSQDELRIIMIKQ